MQETRRSFIKKASAGIALGGLGMSTESYARIRGANERLNFAVVGIRSRGQAHLGSLADLKKDAIVSHICEVDEQYVGKFSQKTAEAFGQAPTLIKDYRKLLEAKDLDAVTIATPDRSA